MTETKSRNRSRDPSSKRPRVWKSRSLINPRAISHLASSCLHIINFIPEIKSLIDPRVPLVRVNGKSMTPVARLRGTLIPRVDQASQSKDLAAQAITLNALLPDVREPGVSLYCTRPGPACRVSRPLIIDTVLQWTETRRRGCQGPCRRVQSASSGKRKRRTNEESSGIRADGAWLACQ